MFVSYVYVLFIIIIIIINVAKKKHFVLTKTNRRITKAKTAAPQQTLKVWHHHSFASNHDWRTPLTGQLSARVLAPRRKNNDSAVKYWFNNKQQQQDKTSWSSSKSSSWMGPHAAPN